MKPIASLVGGLGKAPSIPAPQSGDPAPPGIDQGDTKARMEAASQSEAARRRRTGTILTSSQGVLDQAPVQIKQLLGQ